jgi:hypothetical protein
MSDRWLIHIQSSSHHFNLNYRNLDSMKLYAEIKEPIVNYVVGGQSIHIARSIGDFDKTFSVILNGGVCNQLQ